MTRSQKDGPAFSTAAAKADLGASWYAIHTRSRFEKVVASEMTHSGVEHYLPLVREVHRWKDRRKEVEVPIFPGYIFARFHDLAQERIRILRMPGAVRILGNGQAIESVPDLELDSIRRLLDAPVSAFAHPFLREGAWVRVRVGPLKGTEGLLVRFKNRTRLVLSLTLLRRSVATEVELSDVDVVRPAPQGLELTGNLVA